MSGRTLEQQRAEDAWQKCEGCSKEYVRLAKGLPALIMNSGLMQTMAFLHEKSRKKSHCGQLKDHLLQWLSYRFPDILSRDFDEFMKNLMQADSQTFQQITAEAFAWLRWVRQMAAARTRDD